MYVPAHFDEPRADVLHDLIRRHPFGMLVTHDADGLHANHIPFELDVHQGRFGALLAHVARANPVWQNGVDGEEVLVVFRGADAYVSPNWYPSKAEHHRQVPTWNYVVCHAYGRLAVRDDERFVRGVLARLTRTHESAQPVPWKMGDSPAAFIDDMIAGVVGLEIQISRLIGKAKLGQNKEDRDVRGAGEALCASGHQDLGDAMLATLHRTER